MLHIPHWEHHTYAIFVEDVMVFITPRSASALHTRLGMRVRAIEDELYLVQPWDAHGDTPEARSLRRWSLRHRVRDALADLSRDIHTPTPANDNRDPRDVAARERMLALISRADPRDD